MYVTCSLSDCNLTSDNYRASLDKLAIRGIRSFDDKRLEVIQFFAPVTVIVGQNGSGKTVCTSHK
jgi:predicted ATPase